MSQPISLFWFRRDLRLEDNTALYHALESSCPVLPIFIFDTIILDKLADKTDARVTFIYNQLTEINNSLLKFGSALSVFIGKPQEVIKDLVAQYDVKMVFANHDYEPYAIKRDGEINDFLQQKKIAFKTYKDQVIFEKSEITSLTGMPYKVYTPYKNKWLQTLTENDLKTQEIDTLSANFFKYYQPLVVDLQAIGFTASTLAIPSKDVVYEHLYEYDKHRDFPAKAATSRLGIHLRFGTISIRKLVKKAQSINQIWLSELIWREFFMQLLYHFPAVVDEPFNNKFKRIEWRNNEAEFEKWCEGKTGFPMVDAGMRELNATGIMHNRVRMVVASFLTKNLLIDWRWGEAYFAQQLLDYDLSANNGNWQWSAGTGADAQPFFRIFNPILQQQRFDPDFEYIKKWIPEYKTNAYPQPMIDYKLSITKAKEAYQKLAIQ